MTIDILYYNEGEDPSVWLLALSAVLPEANIRLWQEGDTAPADYALVWNAPEGVLKDRKGLKAVINLAAGVDKLLASGLIPADVPLYRLEDAGMAIQLAEYALHHIIGWYRRFDDYRAFQQKQQWREVTVPRRSDYTVGIMGLGVMGKVLAEILKPFGFALKGWSRSAKQVEGVDTYHGAEGLAGFLKGVNALVCLLPNTPQTRGIINADLFSQLPDGACLVNLGRGAHVNEDDLLDALASGKIHAAALDVTAVEPLPQEHPFWSHPSISITPHIGGLTYWDETVGQVADIIHQLEQGSQPGGLVDRQNGY